MILVGAASYLARLGTLVFATAGIRTMALSRYGRTRPDLADLLTFLGALIVVVTLSA